MSKKEEMIVITEQDKKTFAKFEAQIVKGYSRRNSAMLDIAGAITAIHARELYRVKDFKNIYEYTAEMFDISRASTSNCIKVITMFGNTETGKLADNWSDYTFGQLTRMTRLSDGQLLNITPDTTTREMDELIKNNKAIEEKNETENTENNGETAVDETQEIAPETTEILEENTESGIDNISRETLEATLGQVSQELHETQEAHDRVVAELNEVRTELISQTDNSVGVVVTHEDQIYDDQLLAKIREDLLSGKRVCITLEREEN